ncbi:MAG: hypothetical protein JXB47_14970 [Anaerolineae bacterium]|nr:hypothetical protein [Anaerolineae bacterium]
MREQDRDLERLSAYIDDALAPEERRALEARLAENAALRADLDALRETVQLLHDLPPVRAPRNFTLDPEVYGRRARGRDFTWWSVRLAGALSAAASVALVLGFVLLMSGGMQSMSAPAAAPAAAQPTLPPVTAAVDERGDAAPPATPTAPPAAMVGPTASPSAEWSAFGDDQSGQEPLNMGALPDADGGEMLYEPGELPPSGGGFGGAPGEAGRSEDSPEAFIPPPEITAGDIAAQSATGATHEMEMEEAAVSAVEADKVQTVTATATVMVQPNGALPSSSSPTPSPAATLAAREAAVEPTAALPSPMLAPAPTPTPAPGASAAPGAALLLAGLVMLVLAGVLWVVAWRRRG